MVSVRTIYKCERCGKEQETPEQFWSVGVVAEHGAVVMSDYSGFNNKRCLTGKVMQVCRPCLEAMGIHYHTPPEDPKYVAPPSLEDLIRELVREEISNA